MAEKHHSPNEDLKLMAKDQKRIAPTLIWQQWAKNRAQNAPSLKRVHEISKKVKINVTQLIIEERRGE